MSVKAAGEGNIEEERQDTSNYLNVIMDLRKDKYNYVLIVLKRNILLNLDRIFPGFNKPFNRSNIGNIIMLYVTLLLVLKLNKNNIFTTSTKNAQYIFNQFGSGGILLISKQIGKLSNSVRLN